MSLYDYRGCMVGTYTTPSTVLQGAKISLNPTSATISSPTPGCPDMPASLNEFGYTFLSGNMIYSGSAVFESLDSAGTTPTSSIAVVTRVLSQTPLGQTGDDYNGTP